MAKLPPLPDSWWSQVPYSLAEPYSLLSWLLRDCEFIQLNAMPDRKQQFIVTLLSAAKRFWPTKAALRPIYNEFSAASDELARWGDIEAPSYHALAAEITRRALDDVLVKICTQYSEQRAIEHGDEIWDFNDDPFDYVEDWAIDACFDFAIELARQMAFPKNGELGHLKVCMVRELCRAIANRGASPCKFAGDEKVFRPLPPGIEFSPTLYSDAATEPDDDYLPGLSPSDWYDKLSMVRSTFKRHEKAGRLRVKRIKGSRLIRIQKDDAITFGYSG